ncbi:peptidase C14, caspase domain-containing protein, partial [Gymnopilus junonius]
ALIIGINNYVSKNIPALTGAVSDARAMKAYLVNNQHTPEDHIVILEDKFASHTNIIQGFQCLAKDIRIQPGEPILIYFAGHGSEAIAPSDWEADGQNIQVILPYDALCKVGGQTVEPIPDRTLGALLEEVLIIRVIILDCCHSASGTR